MDLLLNSIKRKAKEVEEHKQAEQLAGKKYVKRRELQQLEEQLRPTQRSDEKDGAANPNKRARTEDSGSSGGGSNGAKGDSGNTSADGASSADAASSAEQQRVQVEPVEVKRRLREMGQPITLFGEGDVARFERMKLMELTYHEANANKVGNTNVFQEIIQQEVADEIMRATEEAMEKEKAGEGHEGTDSTPTKKAEKPDKYAEEKRRDKFATREAFIVYFLKRLLHLWEADLQARPDAEKRSVQGQHASATQKQTRHNMKPLFRLLKSKATQAGTKNEMVELLEKVCTACVERDYVKAKEHYLMLAIGNAAWPIGVTMVGIHERSGREKIFAEKVAHVLNDEQTRKYIQGVERLMTYSQAKFPNALPSRNAG